ncbi:Fc receptor-like B [Gastrophryne carolinensis]
MALTCDTRLDPLRRSTELYFAFYRNGGTVRGFNMSDTYRVSYTKLEDSGNYTCEAKTASGTVTKKSDLFMVEIQKLVFIPEIKGVMEGGEMALTCDTRLDPLRYGTELHFAFYKDGETVREFNFSNTHRVPSDHLEHSANYSCEVRTASGTVMKMSNLFRVELQASAVEKAEVVKALERLKGRKWSL